MAIGIDDLYEEDDYQTQPTEELPPVEEQPSRLEELEEGDLIVDFLKSKGIDDYSRIKFEDDNGNIVERNWNDLSREELFNILNTPIDQPEEQPAISNEDNELTDDEINFLNFLRENNLTPLEYFDLVKGEPQGPSYKIDDLSDDELFLFDLESRVGELNDDEAAQALANAKANEEFYKKLIDGIRKEYREREELQSQLEQATLEEEQRALYEERRNSVLSAINDFNSIGNLEMNFDENDKQTLAEFMLTQDESGNNYLWQALQDPETLTRAAWFILNGDEAFNNIAEYYTSLIKLVSEAQYKKGLEDGKKGVTPKKTVFIDNSKKVNKQPLGPVGEDGKYSIDQLDDEF